MAGRFFKVVLLVIAVVSLFSELGFNVASIIAGLGLGGLAFALAAQKTVENLFGAFAIGVDQPFREGDFVKIEDFMGTVEHLGFRSTRVRTNDRTVITMPNGKLADMRVESFSERDRCRFAVMLKLVYGTTAEQMRVVLEQSQAALRKQPKLRDEGVTVSFGNIGEWSLDVEVSCWFDTADWGEFALIRQALMLELLEIVERSGTTFAFPTRIVQMDAVAGQMLKRGAVPERAPSAGGPASDAPSRAPSSPAPAGQTSSEQSASAQEPRAHATPPLQISPTGAPGSSPTKS